MVVLQSKYLKQHIQHAVSEGVDQLVCCFQENGDMIRFGVLTLALVCCIEELMDWLR